MDVVVVNECDHGGTLGEGRRGDVAVAAEAAVGTGAAVEGRRRRGRRFLFFARGDGGFSPRLLLGRRRLVLGRRRRLLGRRVGRRRRRRVHRRRRRPTRRLARRAPRRPDGRSRIPHLVVIVVALFFFFFRGGGGRVHPDDRGGDGARRRSRSRTPHRRRSRRGAPRRTDRGGGRRRCIAREARIRRDGDLVQVSVVVDVATVLHDLACLRVDHVRHLVHRPFALVVRRARVRGGGGGIGHDKYGVPVPFPFFACGGVGGGEDGIPLSRVGSNDDEPAFGWVKRQALLLQCDLIVCIGPRAEETETGDESSSS